MSSCERRQPDPPSVPSAWIRDRALEDESGPRGDDIFGRNVMRASDRTTKKRSHHAHGLRAGHSLGATRTLNGVNFSK